MADSNQYYYSDKSYILSKAIVYPSTGQDKSVDVMNMMMELTIFEDLQATSISGEIIINDSIDLVAYLPIVGFEFIKLVYSKPGSDTEIDKVYRIYKIDRRIKNEKNQSGQIYSLRFCSEENTLSNSGVFSKSYKGKTPTAIIKDIMTTFLKVSGDRVGTFETPMGMFDIIISSMMPFEAIFFVANRSIPPHFFFENRDGYQFRSWDSLMSQTPVAQYRYLPPNIDAAESGIFRVIDYEFVKSNDVLGALGDGMFSGRLTTVDLLRWKTNNIDYNYSSEFGKRKHLGPGKFENGFQDRFKNTISQNPNALQRLYPTNLQHDTDQNISSRQPGIKPTQVEQWMLQRQSAMEQLDFFKINIVVPGTTAVTVGDVVEFAFPLLSTKSKSEDNLNPYYKGKYLVTAIRHKINLEHYEMIVELTKDSFDTVLPAASNGDAGLNNVRTS